VAALVAGQHDRVARRARCHGLLGNGLGWSVTVEVVDVDVEPVQQTCVPLRVDVPGECTLRLLRLVVVALPPQRIRYGLLLHLHVSPSQEFAVSSTALVRSVSKIRSIWAAIEASMNSTLTS